MVMRRFPEPSIVRSGLREEVVPMLPINRPLPMAGMGWIDIPGWIPGAGDIDLPRVPTTVDEVIELAIPQYQESVKGAQPWLRRRGQAIGKQLVAQGKDALQGQVASALDPNAPLPNPPWLPQVVDPVIDPVLDGVWDEVGPWLTKTSWLTGLTVFGIGAVAGVLLWRLTGRR